MNAALKTFVFALFTIGLVSVPFNTPAARAADDKKEAGEKKTKDTELEKHMEVIDKAMKKLRRTIKDPANNKESLELIQQMQAASVASKKETPAHLAEAPEADRPKLLIGYRKDMAKVIGTMCEMEMALLDNNNDKAADLLKTIKDQEEAGHEKYNP